MQSAPVQAVVQPVAQRAMVPQAASPQAAPMPSPYGGSLLGMAHAGGVAAPLPRPMPVYVNSVQGN
jgi:hypothetical protein